MIPPNVELGVIVAIGGVIVIYKAIRKKREKKK